MSKTLFSGDHALVVNAIIRARKAAGLTQTQLGAKVGRDQKFISIIERSQRQILLLEFCALIRACGIDPVEVLGEILENLPADQRI